MEPRHGIGNDKQSELNPETKNNPSESSIEGSIPGLKVHPGPKHDDNEQTTEGNNLGIKQHSEAKHHGSKTNVEGVATRLSRSSSSSSSSSDDEKGHVHDPLDKAAQDGYQSPEPDAPQWSMVSASPRGGSGNLSSVDGLSRTPERVALHSSPLKSPPSQSMGRGYDPNRIPSSIFSPKPTSPMDWSVNSNESLLSIHMGNNSFSRDSFTAQGLDFGKPEEWNNASEVKFNESNGYAPNLPPVEETPRHNDIRTNNIYVRPGLEEEFIETPKMVRRDTEEDNSKEKMATDARGVHLSTSYNLSDSKGVATAESPLSAARVSNESILSNESFAFPV